MRGIRMYIIYIRAIEACIEVTERNLVLQTNVDMRIRKYSSFNTSAHNRMSESYFSIFRPKKANN